MGFIENTDIKLGGHIGFSKEIFPSIENAIENDMKSFQFFLGNPKSFTRQRLSKEDIVSTYKLASKNDINVFSHYPYTASLNGSVTSLAWNGDEVQDAKTTKILSELEYELKTLSHLSPVNGVVIHPGSYKKTKEGLETISKSINKINFSKNSKLLLENCAGEGTKLCKNFFDIAKVFGGIDSSKKDNVGICIDTAHIHGSGIYNLSKQDDVDKMFYEFDKHIGLDKFNLLHLNDSMVALGSKKDRHECLCEGCIWKEDNTSLKYLLTKCGEKKIPIIIETSDVIGDMNTINLL
jgi:deoxyribonuclease-4